MKKLISILLLILLNISPAAALQIIYPQNNQQVNAYSVFFTGNTKPGTSVMINNEKVLMSSMMKMMPKNDTVKLCYETDECCVCLEQCSTETVCRHHLCRRCSFNLKKQICPLCRKGPDADDESEDESEDETDEE